MFKNCSNEVFFFVFVGMAAEFQTEPARHRPADVSVYEHLHPHHHRREQRWDYCQDKDQAQALAQPLPYLHQGKPKIGEKRIAKMKA